MTVELLQTISLVSFVAAGVMLLVSVAMFFLLDVPKLYGEITGKTAKRAIEAIRQQNETNDNKTGKNSNKTPSHGRVTDKITESGRLNIRTGSLSENSRNGNEYESNETTLLASETTVLGSEANETTVLTGKLQFAGETTVLQNTEYVSPESQDHAPGGSFIVETELHFAVSTELIE